MTRPFVFRESWTLDAPLVRVHAVLLDLEHYPDWWSQVKAVARLDDEHAWVLCRSRLPYTLDLVLTAVHRDLDLLETTVSGDLVGVVRWRLTDVGGRTRLDFEQEVELGPRWLAAAAVVFGPLLTWNHDQMMAGCLEGLRQRTASAAS